MKLVQGVMFSPDSMPELSTPYLGIFSNDVELTELHFRFIREAAEEARRILYEGE